MSNPKRYYWMKLKDTFMTSDTIDYFMSQPDGANYVVLYQMLCLKTINTGGRLSRQIGELIIPYDIEKIQRDCKWFSIDTVRVALKLFQAVGLIYEDVDGVLVLADHKSLVGSETTYALQKRNQRELKSQTTPKLGGHSADKSGDNVHPDIRERDKRLEIRDKSIEKEEEEYSPADEPPSPSPEPPAPEKPKRKAKEEPEIIPSYGSLSPRMCIAVDKWLQYKKERREQYKPTGQQALISEIENNVKRYGEEAVIELINTCMAANWRGIIFEKLKNQPQTPRGGSGGPSGNIFAEMMHERGQTI